jgi:hypothetical protein
VPTTRETIQSALKQNLTGDDDKPVHLGLLPGLTKDEVSTLARSLPSPPPDDFRDLLKFCSGIEGALDRIDFTCRDLSLGFGSDVLLPHALPIAHAGFGNFWAVDLQPGSANWGPIYFCCHDAPVMLLQAATVQQFVSEVLKMYTRPAKASLTTCMKIDCSKFGGKIPV